MPKPTIRKNAELGRKVIYPEITVEMYVGENALTVDKAKEILDYQEVETLSDDCCKELYSLTGIKAVLRNNIKNRYLTSSNVLELRQEILNKRWKLNGDTLVVGRTGLTINCQHRLVALICAAHEWAHPERGEEWRLIWDREPTIETLVCYGVNEDDGLFATINKSKQGTLNETLFRSDYFKGMTANDRKVAAKAAEFAIRKLWDRTGVTLDQSSVKFKTNSETLDFLVRHESIIKAVVKILEFNGGSERKITGKPSEDQNKLENVSIMTPGYAAALLYLMAQVDSDLLTYQNNRSEVNLAITKKSWDKACEFWFHVASNSPVLKELRKAIRASNGKEDWKTALIVKAWNCWSRGENLTANRLAIEHETDDSLDRWMTETMPSVGGIDLGNPDEEKERRRELADEQAASPEEIAKNLKAEEERLKAKIAESQRLDEEKRKEEIANESNKKSKKPNVSSASNATVNTATNGATKDLNGEVLPTKITKKNVERKPQGT